MNATRAATIRLRSAFDGAVSLGRVQTPTLAILARREQEIRDFVPSRTGSWTRLRPGRGAVRRNYEGRYHAGANPRLKTAEEAAAIVAAVPRAGAGVITKLDKSERKERAPLLYDLTSLQRDASSRFGFTLRRTLAAAQRLYEEHKALTYPRTNSRYLTERHDRRDQADRRLVGERSRVPAALAVRARTRRAAAGAGRQRREGHRPPRDHPHPRRAPSGRQDVRDDQQVYDMVVRRFLAVFHPDAVIENTRVETTVADHVFRTRGKRMLVPGWRGVYGEGEDRANVPSAPTTTRGASSGCRSSSRASAPRSRRSTPRQRRPSRRGATPTARWSR